MFVRSTQIPTAIMRQQSPSAELLSQTVRDYCSLMFISVICASVVGRKEIYIVKLLYSHMCTAIPIIITDIKMQVAAIFGRHYSPSPPTTQSVQYPLLPSLFLILISILS